MLSDPSSKAPNLGTRHPRNIAGSSRRVGEHRQHDCPHSEQDIATRHRRKRKRAGRRVHGSAEVLEACASARPSSFALVPRLEMRGTLWLTPDELAGSFTTKRGEVPPAHKHSRPKAPVRPQALFCRGSRGRSGTTERSQVVVVAINPFFTLLP